jgi:hypothetical protein
VLLLVQGLLVVLLLGVLLLLLLEVLLQVLLLGRLLLLLLAEVLLRCPSKGSLPGPRAAWHLSNPASVLVLLAMLAPAVQSLSCGC